MTQQKYMTDWHESFVKSINYLLGLILGFLLRSDVTEEDRKGLVAIQMILNGKDVVDVERDLAAGIVKKSTLDKIERLNKDFTDTCLEHIPMSPLVREFWKQVIHAKIERNKTDEMQRLAELRIPVLEG